MSCIRWAIAQPGFDEGDAFAGFDGGGAGHGANDGLTAGPFAWGRLGGHGHGSGRRAVILSGSCGEGIKGRKSRSPHSSTSGITQKQRGLPFP